MCGRFHIGERMISGLGSAMAPNKISCCKSVSIFHIFINGNNDSFLLKKLLEVHNLLKCHVFFFSFTPHSDDKMTMQFSALQCVDLNNKLKALTGYRVSCQNVLIAHNEELSITKPLRGGNYRPQTVNVELSSAKQFSFPAVK